ncbi:hypothetical protein BX600DRAFT_519057 [Xylariales sp. PMI_506]|nr:hypothetical protein BX600DRAFT_519057 [Xylariales sp. PMI_506]
MPLPFVQPMVGLFAPQLDPALVTLPYLALPAFTSGVTFAPTDTNSFGFAATATFVGSPYDVNIQYTSGAVQSSAKCTPTWVASNPASAVPTDTVTYTGSILCPVANTDIGEGRVQFAFTSSDGTGATPYYWLWVGELTANDFTVVTPTVTVPAPTVPATTTTTSTYSSTAIEQGTGTVTVISSTVYENCGTTTSSPLSAPATTSATSATSTSDASSASNGPGCGVLRNRAALAAAERAAIEARAMFLPVNPTTSATLTTITDHYGPPTIFLAPISRSTASAVSEIANGTVTVGTATVTVDGGVFSTSTQATIVTITTDLTVTCSSNFSSLSSSASTSGDDTPATTTTASTISSTETPTSFSTSDVSITTASSSASSSSILEVISTFAIP